MKTFHFRVTEVDQLVDINQSINQSINQLHLNTVNGSASLQCRRILVGRNLVRVRVIVVAAIFDFMTVEDWGE